MIKFLIVKQDSIQICILSAIIGQTPMVYWLNLRNIQIENNHNTIPFLLLNYSTVQYIYSTEKRYKTILDCTLFIQYLWEVFKIKKYGKYQKHKNVWTSTPHPLMHFWGDGGRPHPKIGVLTPSLSNDSKGLFWPWVLFC